MEYIIYHQRGHGIISSWIAQKKYPGIKLIGWQYHYPSPEFVVSDDRLIIIDFRFSTDILNQWNSQKIEVEQILKNNCESATTVGWKKWFPGQSMPVFLKYVEDWNLGLYELPETQLVIQAIASLGWTFKVFDLFASMSQESLIKFCNQIPKSKPKQQPQHHQKILIPHKIQKSYR
jgi:hypothetical protein